MRRLPILLIFLAAGCSPDAAPAPDTSDAPSSAMKAPAEGTERERALGPFLAEHWKLPIAAQGAPPEGWSAAEASLRPDDCRACHPQQHAQWSSSLHAAAYSPGFAGQLIEGGLAAPGQLRNCQTCHNPLEEQQPVTAAGEPNPLHDPELRAQGLVCAVCHVREHVRYGPPRRDDAGPLEGQPPHGGFEVRAEFQEARFCATCHQFFDQRAVNGKPIENTFREWEASPQAAAGRTCQSCHMPDRAHLWRGIHDADMVRSGVDVALRDVSLTNGTVRAGLTVTNRDVGHAFPTYVTPRVFVATWQVDAAGAAIEGTRAEGTIGRQVDFRRWEEISDTRVLPGETFRLDYEQARAPEAVALVGRVTVDPDFHYRGVFEGYLPSLKDPQARALIAEALERSRTSSFTLAEVRAEL
jgi:hypothetical protein